MVAIAIGVTCGIVGVLVLLGCWACCFYKFYFKPRRDKKKKEGKANDGETGSKHDSKPPSSPPTTKYPGTTTSSVPPLKYPGTTKSHPSYDFNKGVNFAFDNSSDMEKEGGEVKAASHHSMSNGGGYSTYSTSVYQEQYSTDSGTSISEIMDYPHTMSNSRYSGSSDSEGNRSVRFAQELPTLRGDCPPEDGRNKMPKTKMAYWIKPPATPRGKAALPYKYAGNQNPAYVKSKRGQHKARSKDVIAVPMQVPQKSGKRKSRDIQPLQPADVCVQFAPTAEPNKTEPPQSKARKVISMLSRKSDSSRDSKGEDNPFPLLDNVMTAGQPPRQTTGQRPVRTRSILKKPRPESRERPATNQPSRDSTTSQSGTDNSMSETDLGMVRQTTPRRSKRRRPKSIRDVGLNNSDTSLTGQASLGVAHVPSKSPPIAQSSPQNRPKYRKTPENSLDKISYSGSTPGSEVRPRMPYEYYPPKSPGDRVLDDDSLDVVPPQRQKQPDLLNPYDTSNRKSNRSSSDVDSTYFSGSSPRNNYNSNSEGAQIGTDPAQSRQRRKRKKSTRRTGQQPTTRSGGQTQTQQPGGKGPHDNIAFVYDEETTDIYSMSSKHRVQNSGYNKRVAVGGSHSSETEI